MPVYLVAERGSTSPIKISTARIMDMDSACVYLAESYRRFVDRLRASNRSTQWFLSFHSPKIYEADTQTSGALQRLSTDILNGMLEEGLARLKDVEEDTSRTLSRGYF